MSTQNPSSTRNCSKSAARRCAMVTGASSGIGEAIAYRLASKGFDLMLIGLGSEALQQVCSRCVAMNVQAWACETDLSQTASIDALVAYMKEQHVVPDYFVLNAGVSQRALTLDSDFSVDKKLMDINYFGSVYLIKQFRDRLLEKREVHIAVNTSISGLFGFPMRSAYCASKHALFGFFESLELEYPHIKVTFVIPGRINTQISKSALVADGSAYAKMDKGQANGMDVTKCARIAVRAMMKGKHKKLIGGVELLMAYFYKFIPPLFYRLARKVSAT